MVVILRPSGTWMTISSARTCPPCKPCHRSGPSCQASCRWSSFPPPQWYVFSPPLTIVLAAVIREVPHRQNINGTGPFNLLKSEQLVWVIDGVAYLDTLTRRERQGASHGVSIRVARGLYYRPITFYSRPIEWDETVHADTGMLGLTTKHVYFAGRRKRFRVRYDKIIAVDPYEDGSGIMRDAQTAKPQTFVHHRGRTALRGIQPTLRAGLNPGDYQPSLRRVDRGLRLGTPYRSAAGPPYSPRPHPGDER